MLYQALVWGLACYAVVGIAVATTGPVRRLLDHAVAELREGPPADDDVEPRVVPPRKVFLFRAVMSLAIATLWPRFLIFAMRQSAGSKIASAERSIVPPDPDRISPSRIRLDRQVAARRQRGPRM